MSAVTFSERRSTRPRRRARFFARNAVPGVKLACSVEERNDCGPPISLVATARPLHAHSRIVLRDGCDHGQERVDEALMRKSRHGRCQPATQDNEDRDGSR